jgi:hypothetical protein
MIAQQVFVRASEWDTWQIFNEQVAESCVLLRVHARFNQSQFQLLPYENRVSQENLGRISQRRKRPPNRPTGALLPLHRGVSDYFGF